MTLALLFCVIWYSRSTLAWGTPNAPYQYFHQPKIVLEACQKAVSNTATFCDKEKSFACYCYNPAYLLSVVGCLSQCGKFRRRYVDYMVQFCGPMGRNYTLDEIYSAYLNWTQTAVNTLQISNFNKTAIYASPILLETLVVQRYQESFDRTYSNYNHSFYYGLTIVIFWLIVLFIAGICNWSKILFPGYVKRCTGATLTIWRRYISTPALRRRLRNSNASFLKVFDFLVPTRLELVVLALFLLVVIIVCSIDLATMNEDPVYLSPFIARNHYIADRTGIVVLVYMPLLILFSGRNNIMQWITRWSFATFISFHRWVARVAFMLVIVHALCFTIALQEEYAATSSQEFFINGIIAAMAGGLIMLQGLLTLRRRWYEVFLFVHFILAAVFIGCAWAHVTTMGYVLFYYITLAVWILERVVRGARLMIFGCPVAVVSLIADETLRVVVPRKKFWKPIPGGHAFITFWRRSCFWQSHPFTFTSEVGEEEKVVLYCKVKTGVTRSMYEYLVAHPGRKATIRVSLEGPYGEKSAAFRYDSAVFAAGGNGIPGIYSEVMYCAETRHRQRIRLFWIIREYKLLYWFYKELMALRNTSIQTTIYVTKPEMDAYVVDFDTRLASLNDESLQTEHDLVPVHMYNKEWSRESFHADAHFRGHQHRGSIGHAEVLAIIHSELSHIEFKEGRPNIDDIVCYEKESSPGSVAFVACGHPVMVDDMRYAVVHNMENGGKRVDFFEQLQTWA